MRSLVLLLALAAPAPAASLFRPLDLEAARKAASEEKKALLVNFITDHCPPCDRMHLTTLKDPAVLEVLSRRAVAIEINATRLPAPAAKLRITQYPTTVFFSAGGQELDRLMGFHEAKAFLAAFEDALAGRTSVERARAAVRAAKDARARIKARGGLARALAGVGRSDEALAEYLWLFDEGGKEDAVFGGWRSMIPMELGLLGRSHPPALAALRARRDAAAARLASAAWTAEDGAELASLNRCAGESNLTLRTYEALPAGDPRRRALGRSVERQLVVAKRYPEALEASGVDDHAAEFDRLYGEGGSRRGELAIGLGEAAGWAESLAGSGREADASRLLERVFAADASEKTRAMFKRQLELAGRAGLLPPP